jgi:hypothetical protein
MDERFEKQDARIAARFDALQNTMTTLQTSMIITLAGILAAFASAAFAVRL